MDHVLGVVHPKDRELHPVVLLEDPDPLENPVQAVGLVGGAGGGGGHELHPGILFPDLLDLPPGRLVVGIGADKDIQIVVDHRLQGVAEHLSDHRRLVPGRDHNRDRFLGYGFQLFDGDRVNLLPPEEPTVDRPDVIDDVDPEIVEAGDDEDKEEEDEEDPEEKPDGKEDLAHRSASRSRPGKSRESARPVRLASLLITFRTPAACRSLPSPGDRTSSPGGRER